MQVFIPISKVDEEKRMVYGYASTDTLDSQGERITKEALEDALADYMEWANIREMHTNSAVGTAKEANLDSKGLYVGSYISDDTAWKKVKDRVYKGYSVGGKSLLKVNGEIRKMIMKEISLVDRPSNPDCKFDIWKRQNSEKGGKPTLRKKDFSTDRRKTLASSGKALPDGSYPIESVQDLENAIQAFGRAKDKVAVKKHIIARAKALGATDKLPADWEGSTKKEKSDIDANIKKYAGEEIWDTGVALQALSALHNLLQKEMEEDHPEADEQITLLEEVVYKLKEFIASEILEEDPDKEELKEQMVEMAAQIETLKKSKETEGDKEPSPEVVRRANAIHDAVVKLGVHDELDKVDESHLKTIHDEVMHLGADCEHKAEKAESADDIQKLNKGGNEQMEEEKFQKMLSENVSKAIKEATEPLKKQNEELVNKMQEQVMNDTIAKAVAMATEPLRQKNEELLAKIEKVEKQPLPFAKAFMTGASSTVEKSGDTRLRTEQDLIGDIKDIDNISKADRRQDAQTLIKSMLTGRRQARSTTELAQLGVKIPG